MAARCESTAAYGQARCTLPLGHVGRHEEWQYDDVDDSTYAHASWEPEDADEAEPAVWAPAPPSVEQEAKEQK